MKLSLEMPPKIFGIETVFITIYTPLVGLAVFMIISVNLVIVPRFQEFQDSLTKIKSTEQEKQTVLTKVRYLQSIDQVDLKKNADQISSALLPQKNAYLLVDVIRQIADNFGYQMDSFQVSPGQLSGETNKAKKVVSGVSKIPVKMTMVGPAGRYLELVKGLESSLPLLSLEDFKMQNDGQTAKLELNISSFYIDGGAQYDPNKLTLADFTLTKSESEVLTTLSAFTSRVNFSEEGLNLGSKGYVKYNREDPFTP